MDYPELRNFLVNISSPEFVSTIDSACKLFDSFEIDDYLIPIDAVIGENSNNSSDEIVDAVTITVAGILDSILNQHGVFVNPQSTLRNRIEALTCLNNLQHWEDAESIKRTLQLDEGPTEKLALLIEMVCGTPADNVLSYLTEVEAGLIKKIDDYVKDEDQPVNLQHSNLELALMAFQNWKAQFNNAPMWADKFVVHRGSIGLPLQVYLDNFLIDHCQYLDPQELSETVMRELCKDLLTVSCLSEESMQDDGASMVLESIKDFINRIVSDLTASSKMTKCLMDLYVESTRVKK